MPQIFVRFYFTRDMPQGAGEAPRVSPAEKARAALARVGEVLSVEERGPYWKVPEHDEVTILLECEGENARERVCDALARGGWVNVGDDAVWNRGPEAHAEDDRLYWADVIVL